jgi:hypothetical protein
LKRSYLLCAAAILVFLGSPGAGAGQRPTRNPVDLAKLSSELLRESAENRAEARAAAEAGGWPVTGARRGGGSFALEGFEYGLPFYYTTFNLESAVTTRTDSVQHYIGGGAGFTIGLWDGDAPRLTHQELAPRVTWADVKTAIADDHATHVAGTMIGLGVRPEAKGMAPEATIKAFQWDDDLSEMAAEAGRGLLVSNHSYGYVRGWTDLGEWYWFGDSTISETEDYLFGFYSSTSRAMDELLAAAPNFLPIFSAGNDRNDGVAPGTPHYYWDVRTSSWRRSVKVRDNDGAPDGYDCLPNGPAVSKNALTIGAVHPVSSYTGPESVEMSSFSSWGPTDDGRIKPDLCGDGWAVYSSVATSDTSYDVYYGTSMAAPNVCGSLGLLQDYYRDTHHAPMKAATLKALAIHTAREAGAAPGPDYGFGWGLLDAYAAYREITADLDERKGLIDEYTLHDGVPIELYYQCDGTASELKVTIAWTDPPGTCPAPAVDPPDLMLVNDLDLSLEKDGSTFEPWVLDPANPMNPAAPGNNIRDNVEQVEIADPEAGTYVVRIDHKGSLAGGGQDFSIVVSGAVRTRTWNVYANGAGDAPTIAAAVDSAAEGDQIFVYQGSFREHDIVVDKPVTIRGVGGVATTIVDAGYLGRCLILPSGAGAVRIQDLTLKNGEAMGEGVDGFGGAILSRNVEAEIAGCVITRSRARRGGGLYIDGGLGALKSCTVLSNTATENGGGVYDRGGSASIDRCVVAWNTAEGHGGGFYFDASSSSVAGCTASHNAAEGIGATAGLGGGMCFAGGSGVAIARSIIAFSVMGAGVDADEPAGSGIFSCCDMIGNAGGNFGGGAVDQSTINGNFSLDPQFCDVAHFDFRVGDGSPCLAENNACGVPVGALGAHCHSKTTWYVRADGAGDEPTIQAAVDRAVPGDTIVLAAGTYSGDGNRDIDLGGKNLVIRSAAGADSTVVDCGGSIGEIHSGFTYQTQEDSTSVLEGLRIRFASLAGVRCSGASPLVKDCVIDSCIAATGARGGAIYIEKASPTILGCTIRDNRADASGGGVFARESASRIERCVISSNVAAQSGGGVAVQTSSNMDIVGCTFSENLASASSGGGVSVVSARVRIDSCTFFSNTGSFGGGVFNGTSGTSRITRCVLYANAARTGGGGVYSSSNLTMESSTVVGNSAASVGAGLECFNGAQNTIARSIIASNLVKEGIYTGNGTQVISCSDVYGNAGGNYGGTTSDQTGKNDNISASPSFCDEGAFDLALYDTSPCAPAGSPCGQLIGALPASCRIAPNLVIAAVGYTRTVAPAHSSLFVTVTVMNAGVAPADSFTIDFYRNLGAAPGPSTPADDRRLVHSLAAGDTAVLVTAALVGDTIGAWASWAAVDPEGWVDEQDESDNVNGPDTLGWIAPREPGWPVAVAMRVGTSPLLVDADGDPSTIEVFAGSVDGKIYGWTPAGTPLPGWPVDLGSPVMCSAAAADIAGDAGVEILGCNASGLVMAFSSAGEKLWEHPATNGMQGVLALADLDGDGKLEVLCGSQQWQTELHALDGDGSPMPWAFGTSGASWMSAPAIGDADGDGKPEVAVVISGPFVPARSPAGSGDGATFVFLLEEDGEACPGWPVSIDAAVTGDPVIGDIAGDHSKLEIAVAAADGTVHAWYADGTACFPPVSVPGTPATPALADFDRDGYHDIAVTSWKLNEGSGLWEGYTSIVSGRGVLASSRKIYERSNSFALPGPIAVGRPASALAGTPDGAVRGPDRAFTVSCCSSIVSTLAAGDIDGDGWVEVLALSGDDSLYAYELCTSDVPPDALPWAQFRRDPARAASFGYEPVSGVDEDEGAAMPKVTSLRSIYPNPFNPAARISFEVSTRGRVRIAVFDVAGRSVAVIVDGDMAPGRYEAIWDGRTVAGRAAASGIYFCRLTAGSVVATKKMVLIR